jgi:hypothetical protein
MLLFVQNMHGRSREKVYLRILPILTLFISGSTFADPTANVFVLLSSDSPIYQDALTGFKETCKHPVQTQILGGTKGSVSGSPKIVVSFGRRAAETSYPMSTIRIFCLDPGLDVAQGAESGHQIVVSISPTPEALLSGLQKIQPHMKRLAVFWVSPTFSDYFNDMRMAAQAMGVAVRAEHMDSSGDFPEKLREVIGHVDALWVAPDFRLITPTTFAVAKAFGRSNNLPLYVAIDNLVDIGAVASIAPDFHAMGRTAGRLTTQALAGELSNVTRVYPETSYMTINLNAAAQSGLAIPDAVVKVAHRVVR